MYVEEAEAMELNERERGDLRAVLQAFTPENGKKWNPFMSEAEKRCIKKDMQVRAKAFQKEDLRMIEWVRGHLAGAHELVIFGDKS